MAGRGAVNRADAAGLIAVRSAALASTRKEAGHRGALRQHRAQLCRLRRPDPRIAALIHAALGDAASVVNVGAGTGSYEPADRAVLAVEPSEVMIRQRPAGSCARVCREGQRRCPWRRRRSTRHWAAHGTPLDGRRARHSGDGARGAPARRPPELGAGQPTVLADADYFPEITALDETIFATTPAMTGLLERSSAAATVSPFRSRTTARDGFLGAYWRRRSLSQRRGRERHLQLLDV